MAQPQVEGVGRIRRAAQHLATVIGDGLNYAPLDAARIEFELAPAPLDAALRQLEGFVGTQMTERGFAHA